MTTIEGNFLEDLKQDFAGVRAPLSVFEGKESRRLQSKTNAMMLKSQLNIDDDIWVKYT